MASDDMHVVRMLESDDSGKNAYALVRLMDTGVFDPEYAELARLVRAKAGLVGLNTPVSCFAAAYLHLGGFEPYRGDDPSTIAIIDDFPSDA